MNSSEQQQQQQQQQPVLPGPVTPASSQPSSSSLPNLGVGVMGGGVGMGGVGMGGGPIPGTSQSSHSSSPSPFDDDAKTNSLFDPRPVKKAKLSDDHGGGSMVGGGGAVGPTLIPLSRVLPAGPSMPSIVPTFSQTPAMTDGYKFQVNAEVEYIIPDEDLYWSFGWLRVRILSRSKKQIGTKQLPYYLVEHLDGAEPTQTTVEEWQLRPTNKNPTGMHGKKLQKHSRVEVHSTFEDPMRPETWFCAEVSEDSPVTDDFVRVRFRNNKWNMGKSSNEVHKQRVRPVPNEDLIPTHGLSAKIWAIGDARLPIRLIADEEHRVSEIIQRWEEVRARWSGISRISPIDFESDRDVLNELCDSLNNARHYNKSAEIIQFLIDVQRRFE
eukprot:TRINITY_DN573_c0_g2_i1.p1 TRINITY_DN573_c0_g2~~TRINITY_DN573_c0_g2_i1.p1  ORF type:complete len:383 (-),score=71.32 TRINITY_DN573_c0_g2_i1:911-2059(-)